MIDLTHTPFDPILNRGRIVFGPLLFVGTQPDGTIRLADTDVQILDTQTGDTLMHAYLLEAAYMPPNVEGYAGMIQGYLDVPPVWAGGVRNTIGSPFLSGMQVASETGWQTTAWIYTRSPLFDANGDPAVPPSGVAATVAIGVAPQAPAALPALPRWGVVAVLLLVLGVLVLWRRRRMVTPE